jgi:hypothetical protein
MGSAYGMSRNTQRMLLSAAEGNSEMQNYITRFSLRDSRVAQVLFFDCEATEKLSERQRVTRSRSSAFVSCCIIALSLALSLTARMSAQTFGDISGHVADSTGAVIPDTTVTLTNVGTAGVRNTMTTASGDYTFTAVPVGVYKIQATHAGFKTASSNNVTLQIQQSLRLDFTLEVGAVTDSIEVSASAALLQSENATLGTVVENKAVNELPLNGRNFFSLVALSSNVNTLSSSSGQAGSRMGGERASQAISVGGQRIMFDYYTLDGINNTDPDFNTYVALPSVDGLQEFKVQTGVYSAEFGHESSQINVVSKSGTNTYHGSMYDFVRNNTADATPYYFPYNTTPPTVYPFKWNDYGFELDGPIRIPHLYNGRDKFFFMIDDEWRKIRQTSQGNAVVPTAAMVAGNFQGFTDKSGNPVTIYDPATGDANGFGKTPFANNTIPSGRIAPQTTAFLKYLGTSTKSFYSNGAVQNNYSYTTTGPQNRQSLTVRGDFYQSVKSQWGFRYSSGKEDIMSTGLLGAGSKIITNYYQYMGSNTYTLTPQIVNEARFGYSHFYNSTGLLSAFTHDVVDELNIPGLSGGDPSTWGIPSMGWQNGPTGTNSPIWSGFGDQGGDGPYVVTDPTWQIVDNIGWVKGKHSLRIGFEYNRQTFNQLGNQFSRGQFSAGPYSTALQSGTVGSATLSGGEALADFLLGNLYQSTVAVAVANADYKRNVQGYYVDDTYKILPNLTISAGLRYELTPPWVDSYGNVFNVNIQVMPKLGDISTTYAQSQWPQYLRQGNCAASDVYKGLSIRWTTTLGPAPACSNGVLPNGALLDTQYLNLAPRLGISYSPTSKTVIRTGFGIFYAQDIGNAYFDMARNIAGRVTVTNTDSTSGVFGSSSLTWANASPGANGGTISNLGPTTAFSNAVSHKTTYTEQYLLNIQQQVGQDWSFEVGYQGAVHRHLYGFLNANQATPIGYAPAGSPTSVAGRTPFANMGGIQYVHDMASGNYNAFSMKATRRFSNGFNVIASYTWGKSLDNSSGVRNQGNDNLYPQNSRCISCEYGRSAFDVKHRIVGSALYELPIGPGKLVPVNNKGLNMLIGGWQVGGIFTHQTGQVGTPLRGSDISGIASAFGNFDRPNPTGTSPYLSGSARSLSTWVNKAAYTSAAAGFFGTLQRGSYTGPSFTGLDASLHKNVVMPYNEKHQISIRFEAFNALNHPNWNNPTLNYSSSTFGRITSTSRDMRQLQLAAKYQF